MSSTAARIISGGVASWVKIGLTFFSQIVLVPIYLSFWSVNVYGVWIAIQALVGMLTILDFGHQSFLEFEFLRYGAKNRPLIRKTLWSGMLIGFLIGIFQLVILLLIIFFGILPVLLKQEVMSNSAVFRDAGIILFLQGVAWLLTGSLGGIANRALAPFGYYPRLSWWGVFMAFFTGFMPVFAVMMGAGLLGAGITLAVTTTVFAVPVFVDMFFLLRKESIGFAPPSIQHGLRNFYYSIILAAKTMLEKMSREGVRLILAPLAGIGPMAAFATMRTGANVALQGLSTITNPLMPELMRFLGNRDQIKTEMALSTVWVVLVAFMAPAVVLVQVFVEPLYAIWTRGQIQFNSFLFALLSQTVLTYALSQPAISIVRGNNLLKLQLLFSSINAFILIASMAILVPYFGIVGAGYALLFAEVAGLINYSRAARSWLHKNDLKWPAQTFNIALVSIIIGGISMASMALFPSLKIFILFVSILLLFVTFFRFWSALPFAAKSKASSILSKLPFYHYLMFPLKLLKLKYFSK